MPTHIRALGNETKGKEWNGSKRKAGRQFDRCRRLSGCLTDSQKWVWPVEGRERGGKGGPGEKWLPIILCIVLCGIYTRIFVVF